MSKTLEMDWNNIEETLLENETVFIDIRNPNDSLNDEFHPAFNKVAAENTDVKFARINAGLEPDLVKALGVNSTPTLMVFKKRVDILQKTDELEEQTLQDLVEVVRFLNIDEMVFTN